MKIIINENQYKKILSEGRKEDLMNKYQDDFSQLFINSILNDQFMIKTNYKYGDFFFANTKNENNDLLETLVNFDRINKNLEKKDIKQYKSIDELQDAVDLYLHKKSVNAEYVYEDSNFLVVKPLNINASCKYGAGTKWCTTERYTDRFEHYTSGTQGLYYAIQKDQPADNNLYKFAIHFDEYGSESWWDSHDKKLSPSECDILRKTLPKLYSAVKKDYGIYEDNLISGICKTLMQLDGKVFRGGYFTFKFDTVEYNPDFANFIAQGLNVYYNNKLVDDYVMGITVLKENDEIVYDISFDAGNISIPSIDLELHNKDFLIRQKISNSRNASSFIFLLLNELKTDKEFMGVVNKKYDI